MNKENIRKLLKSYRDKQGLKQDYVASKLGISKKAYSKIETGENGLRVDYIPVLCEVLDIPYFTLLSECLDVRAFLGNDNYDMEHEVVCDCGDCSMILTRNEYALYEFICKVLGLSFPNKRVLQAIVDLTNVKRYSSLFNECEYGKFDISFDDEIVMGCPCDDECDEIYVDCSLAEWGEQICHKLEVLGLWTLSESNTPVDDTSTTTC